MKNILRMPIRGLALVRGAVRLAAHVVWVAALWAISSTAMADWQLNLTQGVTEISHRVYDMHMFVLWICTGIGVVVFGAMAYSIIYHRKSKGVKPATFHESLALECVWTFAPFVILVILAVPAAKTLIAMERTEDADITLKVTGHQWKWEYEYVNEGIRFISSLHPDHREAAVLNSGVDPYSIENYLLEVDKRVVVPVDKKVRILLTASDVLHAWWMPAVAVKKDAVPGFINAMWFQIEEEGVYRGQCAELCGRDHGFMPIVVEAVSQGAYDEWVTVELAAAEAEANSADREWGLEELVERGEGVYGTSCAACHQGNGQGIEGVFPSLVGSPIILGEIADHIDVVMNGLAGTAMQPFATTLNDADIAAVITFERNAWGNDTGDIVQPAAVKAARVQ